MHPEQVQDFMPLPMTVSTCMYYTGKHPMTEQLVATVKTYKERQNQRAIVQPSMEQHPTRHGQRKDFRPQGERKPFREGRRS